MNGTLAAIFLIASLTDMTLTDCATGCLTPSDAPARLSFQLAEVQFGDVKVGNELYLGYDMGTAYGPFQPTFGTSLTDTGDGPDIGGSLQFRSALGVGYQFDNGATILAAYDHRSNADTQPLNPGLETVSIRLAIPF